MVLFISRAAVGLGLVVTVGTAGCGTSRDALYTQLPTPDDARIVDGDPHLVDDHGDVHVHTSHKVDPLVDARDKVGDLPDGDEATDKIRDR
jgi:hypothetical protein